MAGKVWRYGRAFDRRNEGHGRTELLSNLVFEDFGSRGDLVLVGDFNSVFKCDASDDFGEVVKAA